MPGWWITYIDPIDKKDRIAIIAVADNEEDAKRKACRMLNIKESEIKKVER